MPVGTLVVRGVPVVMIVVLMIVLMIVLMMFWHRSLLRRSDRYVPHAPSYDRHSWACSTLGPGSAGH
jgi:hypothetical protein